MKRDPNVGWHETLDKIAAEYENKTNKDDDDREDDEDSYNNSRYSRSGGGGRYGGGGYGERRSFVARDRKGPSNDIVRVYTSLISAYGKGGQWEIALAAFQELVNTPGCFCDTGSHNALLSAAVSAAKYPEAAQLFTSMAKNPRVRRNVTTYNSLITSYGKQRKIGDMESIFAQMARNGVFANETTHAVMIAAHGNNTSTGDKDCKRTLDLLTRCARNPKLRCSAVVFNFALGACAKQSDHESFNLVLKMM
jgi:pentatricopeptide repeat protein